MRIIIVVFFLFLLLFGPSYQSKAQSIPQPKSVEEVKSMQLGSAPEAKPYALPKTEVVSRPYDGKEAVQQKGHETGTPQEETSGEKFKNTMGTFGRLFLRLFKGSSIRVGA